MQLDGGDVVIGAERRGGAAQRAQGDCTQQQRAAQPVRNGLRERRPRRACADGHGERPSAKANAGVTRENMAGSAATA
ncbi:hypothetical protein R20233_03143 [Ralstonia sp. LMG 32965]|uniref:hypothetical protein n=1 Tax=Ralstonia flatus TaxID=3058601 RepID=UPI0028F56C67|nr:hypothetical protein [Ralstonia sp. LMG 32965]CAJ0886323.1 hypothetical protein R20233_03143 [Ralstonia sp. LMG 32965]